MLPCCRAAALPRCRAAVLPCCRAAALLRCRAAAQAYRQTTLWTCCCPGIQADTALDVLLPRHPGRHRAGRPRIALNLPHEFTRVRCDVSGVCLAAACQSCSCAPITRCNAGLGAVATDDAPCPPHSAVLKKNTPRAFSRVSKKKYPRQRVSKTECPVDRLFFHGL